MDYTGFIGLPGGSPVEKAACTICLDCSFEDEGLGTLWLVSRLGTPTDNCLFLPGYEISERKTMIAPSKASMKSCQQAKDGHPLSALNSWVEASSGLANRIKVASKVKT